MDTRQPATAASHEPPRDAHAVLAILPLVHGERSLLRQRMPLRAAHFASPLCRAK